MPADPSDAAEIADIEKTEASLASRRDALAAKWGEGAAVMRKPGDAFVMLVIKGKLKAVAVHYLTGGGS